MEDLTDRLNWFEATILPHEAALRARLRRMMPRGFDIDDAASEILMRAYAADGWREVESGRGFLFRIARNFLIDRSRREKIVAFDTVANMDLLEADDRTRSGLEARDELRRLESAIETLPIQCRRVFVLRRVYEWSAPDIAEQMGLSVSTVEKHLTKAVGRISVAMAECREPDLGQPLAEQQRTPAYRGGRRSPAR